MGTLHWSKQPAEQNRNQSLKCGNGGKMNKKMTRKFISYATFQDRRFHGNRNPVTRSRRSKSCRMPTCYLITALAVLAVTLYILYLRISMRPPEKKPPWPPNRKMGGVLTYEFGYLVWDPLPKNKSEKNNASIAEAENIRSIIK